MGLVGLLCPVTSIHLPVATRRPRKKLTIRDRFLFRNDLKASRQACRQRTYAAGGILAGCQCPGGSIAAHSGTTWGSGARSLTCQGGRPFGR